jgi:hypothetical protein
MAASGFTDFHPALPDADFDGVGDQNEDPDSDNVWAGAELAAGISTLNWDSDYDGCLDLIDAAPAVNPSAGVNDVDGDGMPSGPGLPWSEMAFGVFPDTPLGRHGHNGNFDFDLATNFMEYLQFLTVGGVAPFPAFIDPSVADADVDLDTLGDAWELFYWPFPAPPLAQGPFGNPDGDPLNNLAEFRQGTNPTAPDLDPDLDGMANGYEIVVGTNPAVADGFADPDGDGFITNIEWNGGSHPTIFTQDWDLDWICDVWENANGLSNVVDSRNLDPDADTFVNWVEYIHGYNPGVANADVDADGLADAWEVLYSGGIAMAPGANADGDGFGAGPACAPFPGWWPAAFPWTNLMEFQTSSHPFSPDLDANLVDPASPPACSNAIPDTWEKKYSTITGYLQWGVDRDGDAVMNEFEFAAGTNPDDVFN